mgnify:FL=1|tara:strand:+ start:382 stop:903 length:522 start_codon:yes stop_codon:yes gene_type:complete
MDYIYSQLINLSPPKKYNKKVFNRTLRQGFDIVNRNSFNKPSGGLWTSTYRPYDENQSRWIEWCHENMQSDWVGNDCILIEISQDARIFKIDEYQDLKNLYALYPLNTGADTTRHIDFEKIKPDWDIIWLTGYGQWQTRNSSVLNLYGWDCESSLILNNVVNRFKKITTTRSR